MENILPKSMSANNYNELNPIKSLKRRGGIILLSEAEIKKKYAEQNKGDKGTIQEQREWREFKRLKKINISLNEYNEWFKKKDMPASILTEKQLILKNMRNIFVPLGNDLDDNSEEIQDTEENHKLKLI